MVDSYLFGKKKNTIYYIYRRKCKLCIITIYFDLKFMNYNLNILPLYM